VRLPALVGLFVDLDQAIRRHSGLLSHGSEDENPLEGRTSSDGGGGAGKARKAADPLLKRNLNRNHAKLNVFISDE
jgi:hypothetical protein